MSAAAAGILFVANASLVGYTATRVARRQSHSPLDFLFYSLLVGVSEVVAICLLLGVVGLLAWPEVLVAEIVLAAYGRFKIPAAGSPGRPTVWWPAVIAGVVILSISCVVALSSRSTDADTITYHLVNAAAWLHNGNIWQLPFTTPNGPDATAPGNGDIFTTWLMMPSHSDQIVCLTPIIFGSLCVLATAQLARALGATTRRGVVVGLVIMAIPAIAVTQSHSALVDLAGPAFIVSALVLAFRARAESRDLLWVCAGFCLGFAAGSKVVDLLPSVLALFIAMSLANTRRWHALALLIGGYIPLGAVWYVRNWIEAGNPLFPDIIRFGPLNFRGAPLVDNTSILAHIVMGHWATVGTIIGIAAEIIGPALAVLVVAVFGARHAKAVTGRIGLLAALITLGYLVTPYTGGGPAAHTDEIATAMRYLFPALFVAAGVTAAVLNVRSLRILVAVSALYSVIVLTKAGDFRSDLTVTPMDIAVAALVAVALCGAIAIAAKMFRSGYRAGVRTAIAATVIAFCGAWALYSRIPAQASDGVIQTLGHRVAAVGVPYPRYLLGADLSTTVVTVGDGPQGAQTIIEDKQAFDKALADLNVNVLAVGWTNGIVPKGWTVGDDWVAVGEQAGAIVYRRR